MQIIYKLFEFTSNYTQSQKRPRVVGWWLRHESCMNSLHPLVTHPSSQGECNSVWLLWWRFCNLVLSCKKLEIINRKYREKWLSQNIKAFSTYQSLSISWNGLSVLNRASKNKQNHPRTRKKNLKKNCSKSLFVNCFFRIVIKEVVRIQESRNVLCTPT